MFIDYVSLMLINLAAGLALLAAYVYFGLGSSNQRRWIPGFGSVGAIALVTTLYLKSTRILRTIGAIVLIVPALFFAFIGLSSYWVHLADFSTWKPLPMQSP